MKQKKQEKQEAINFLNSKLNKGEVRFKIDENEKTKDIEIFD